MAAKLERPELVAMFHYWIQTRNISATAKRFGHSRSVIRRAHKAGNWELRRQEIEKKSDEKLSEKIADQTISDFQVTTALLSKGCGLILDDDSQIKPTYGDISRLFNVRAEMTGDSIEDLRDEIPSTEKQIRDNVLTI